MLGRVRKKNKKNKKNGANPPLLEIQLDDPIATDNAFSIQEDQKKDKGLYMYGRGMESIGKGDERTRTLSSKGVLATI